MYIKPTNSFSLNSLLNDFDSFLFDGDGTLWVRGVAIPGTVNFLKTLVEADKNIYIVTNNSMKTREEYIEYMISMGFPKIPEEHIISPAVVYGDYRKKNGQKPGSVYLVGSDTLKNTIQVESEVSCLMEEVFEDSDNLIHASAVICGWTETLCPQKVENALKILNHPETELIAIDMNLNMRRSNEELELHTVHCLANRLRLQLGREPIYFGKPDKHMDAYVHSLLKSKPDRTIMFGDRLDTDIAFANQNGFTSCFVPNGYHTIDDMMKFQEQGNIEWIPKLVVDYVDEKLYSVN